MNKWRPKIGVKVLVRWAKRTRNPRDKEYYWRTGFIRSMKGGWNEVIEDDLFYYKIEFIPNTGETVTVSSREIPDRLRPYSRMAEVLYSDESN